MFYAPSKNAILCLNDDLHCTAAEQQECLALTHWTSSEPNSYIKQDVLLPCRTHGYQTKQDT